MAKEFKTMVKQLEKMREIRIQQKDIRVSLQKREERNKQLREQITPIWTDPCKEYEVYQLNKELIKGREKVRGYQRTLREFKVNLRETNRSYDLSARG